MMKFVKMLKSEKGFTLIELIFVVIILAVLAGIALVNMGSSEDDAKIAVVKSDLQTVATALKVYKAKEGSFPTDTQGLTVLKSDSADGKYKAMLDEIPVDPFSSSDAPYVYSVDNDAGTATIHSCKSTTSGTTTTYTYTKTVK